MSSPAHDAAAFLRTHVRDEVALADVADAVGYSPFHLSRQFTAAIGMSPMRYLACHRFHLAKHLLLTEDLGVVHVCHEVGFSSPGTFTRRFRSEVGVTPGELRVVADDVADHSPTPFRMAPPAQASVTGRVETPESAGSEPLVWIGLFAHPAPTGVPCAGLLRHGPGEFQLPVVPGFPWLLATVVSASADPITQLADDDPFIAVHPSPVLGPVDVTLSFRRALPWEPPILTALPALRKIGGS